jgi:hypothetical protein
MSMRLSKTRWIIVGLLGLIVLGTVVTVFTRTESRSQDHLCWDAPSVGTPPQKYVVTVDGGSPIETTIECVRVPLGLSAGEHIAVVRAVDALGQMSPPASLRFVEP